MSKRDSNWYVPADWLCHFGMIAAIMCLALLAGILLPVVARLKTAEVTTLYGGGVVAGAVGAGLLFFARLPLYQQRRFWTFGARRLDRKHRWLYWLAYVAVGTSLSLLWVVWLKT